MGHDQAFPGSGEGADATSLREATDPTDVGLGDLHPTLVDQDFEVVAGRQPLSGRDPHRRSLRQLCVSRDVVRPERRLEEEDVESLPQFCNSQRAFDRIERVLDVDHDRHPWPDGRAHCSNHLGDAVVWADEPLVHVRP